LQIKPLLRKILTHPDLFASIDEPNMLKTPVVYAVGVLRALARPITDSTVSDYLGTMGQTPYFPPNVSGWNDRAWLDTSRLYGRWYIADYGVRSGARAGADYAGSAETGAQALDAALAHVGRPTLPADSLATLLAFANQPAPVGYDGATYRALRQNALRQLVASCPDHQVC